MFPFVVLKIIYQIPRNIPWHTQLFIIISKQTVLIYTAFCVRNLLWVIFIPNTSYCIITIWNFRSINSFFIFSPDMIILFFWKDCNIPTKHCFNLRVKFITLTDSLFTFTFINNINFSLILLSLSTKVAVFLAICFASFNRNKKSSLNFPICFGTYDSNIIEVFISYISPKVSDWSEVVWYLVNDVMLSFVNVSLSTSFTVSCFETFITIFI